MLEADFLAAEDVEDVSDRAIEVDVLALEDVDELAELEDVEGVEVLDKDLAVLSGVRISKKSASKFFICLGQN